jgi:serine protease Do
LEAFRDVSREPAKCTVQIYCDGYRAALGAIVRPDGFIVTKASELKGNVQIKLNNPKVTKKFDATTIATDKTTDLAVLKIDAKDLPVVSWSDTAPSVGSWLATASPENESVPVTIGVVSVGARKISTPSGALGIQLDEVDHILRIKQVMDDSPAAQAGLQEGDVIRRINGKEVTSRQSGQETIRSYQPGDQVELTVERGGSQLKVRATLSSLSILMNGERADFQNKLGGHLSERRAGFPLAIQHDSVLRPIDCGGPLIDLDGKAVGLNIARAGRVESYALPAALVRETLDKLLQAQLTSAGGDDKLVGKSGNTDADKKVH